MMMSLKKGEGKIRGRKASIRSTHKGNEGVQICGRGENVKRWKMGTCNSARKIR